MKKYTIEVIEEKNGSITIKRHAEGFSGFECLGFVTLIQNNIMQMIKGEVPQPKYITTREKEKETE